MNWLRETLASEPTLPKCTTKYEGVLNHNDTFDRVRHLVKDAVRLAYVCYSAVDIAEAYPLHRAADQVMAKAAAKDKEQID